MSETSIEGEQVKQRRRTDGIWHDTRTPGKPVWCIRWQDLGGRWHRERTVATTREEARALRARKMSEIARAKSLGLTSPRALTAKTLRGLRAEFLADCDASNNKKTTIARYEDCLAHLISFFGSMALGAISPGDVERYVAERRNTVRHRGKCRSRRCSCPSPAPATVNRERAVLHKALNMAMRRGLIDRNPVAAVKPLKENNVRDRFLEVEEERRIRTCAPRWLDPIIVMGVQTGMRLGEILAIRRADVDRTRALLRVPETKNGKVRHVPLNGLALGALDSIPPHVGPNGPSAFVFVNFTTGEPYERTSVAHAFQRAAKLAGLETKGPARVTPHTLRHTAVSRLVAAGIPDRQGMALVGHATPEMFARYAHLAPEGFRDAAEALARASNPPEKRTRSVQNG
ncbi:MAG: site-specific integrase [Planctomycetes bacterium]|nr:site-specific integrase [Planctomycetota bacterium]